MEVEENSKEGHVAIVGMSCRFPGASDLESFWQNLKNGKESIVSFSDDELEAAGVPPELIGDPAYIKVGSILDDVEKFDADFFNFSPREAEILDPQQRIFLECSWEALENAGCCSDYYDGVISVFAGQGINTYMLGNLSNLDRTTNDKFDFFTANDKDFLATRVSYKLNLKGPSLTVQSACSTSMVAVHLACQSLQIGESDMALAGGVSVRVPQVEGYLHTGGYPLSADGHCCTFDESANGTVFGNGAGVIVLKRLEDAIEENDHVYAVVRSIAINNDGSSKIGFTAPSVQGQASVIIEAHELAEVNPGSITYVEAHGTGTEMGDPIEVSALTEAFRANTSGKGFCAIGSLKTNVGHMDTAAGVGAIIKTALSLQNKMIPPSLNFKKPNPNIDFENSPFYVNAELQDWKVPGGMPRRAGVSAFGIGGTNSHLILEESPPAGSSGKSRPWQIVTLSARSEAALDKMTSNLASFLEGNGAINLSDIAYTLNTGRKTFNYKRVCVVDDVDNAITSLETLDRKSVFTTYSDSSNSRIVFMFPGQDSIYLNMGSDLYANEPVFKYHVDYCADKLMAHLGVDIRDILFCSDSSLDDEDGGRFGNIRFMQPIVFVFEYALARLWMACGVKPDAMVGHSIGEYVAACLSEVMSLDDALDIVAYRGDLLEKLPDGKNIAVSLSEKDTQKYLTEKLSIAVITTSSLCVVSGRDDDVNALEQRLQGDGVDYKSLNIPKAAHSILMEPIIEPLRDKFKNIELNPPKVPFVSCITGEWIQPEQAVDPNYWAMHVRNTVRFADAIRTIADQEEQIFVEVGPGRALSSLVKLHVGRRSKHVVLTSSRNPQSDECDDEFFLKNLGKVWLTGISVDWRQYYEDEKRHRIPLPTYPFERKRFWVESSGYSPAPKSKEKKASVDECLFAPSWKRSGPLTLRTDFEGDEGWLVFSDGAGLSRQVSERLLAGKHHVMDVRQGIGLAEEPVNDAYHCDSRDEEACCSLIRAIGESGKKIDKVLFFLSPSMGDGGLAALSGDNINHYLEHSFFSLLNIVRALEIYQENEVQVNVVSRCASVVTGDEDVDPFHAVVASMVRVVHNESLKIKCRNIDFNIDQGRTFFSDRELEQLLRELPCEIDARLVAYRGQYRWTQCFEKLTPLGDDLGTTSVKDGGVYLITGGLAGIGYILAKHVAKQGRVTLVLAEEACLPNQEEWQGWIDSHGDDHKTSVKIKRIIELQNQGSHIVVHPVDISSFKEMTEVVTQIKDEFGAVDGVIHAAGKPCLSGFIGQTREVADNIFNDKIKGAIVLGKAIDGESLDFFILCSSISSVDGSIGKIVNSSADAFLDSFAHMGLLGAENVTTSVNFDTVEGCMHEYQSLNGLSGDADAGESQGPVSLNRYSEYLNHHMDMALKEEEVGNIFDQIVGASLPQIVVSTRDVDRRKEENGNFSKITSGAVEALGDGSRYDRPQLDNSYEAPESPTEVLLAGIWEEVLGIDKIGVYDSFFDLGGNSLLATRVISRIRETFGVTVPVKSLFNYLYIRDLSKLIVDQRSQGNEEVSVSSGIVKQKKKITV
ncbi:MAG: SDR family NAD(P)-dependent oxidoreductase [Thermodesulfobacteriota bacterium]